MQLKDLLKLSLLLLLLLVGGKVSAEENEITITITNSQGSSVTLDKNNDNDGTPYKLTAGLTFAKGLKISATAAQGGSVTIESSHTDALWITESDGIKYLNTKDLADVEETVYTLTFTSEESGDYTPQTRIIKFQIDGTIYVEFQNSYISLTGSAQGNHVVTIKETGMFVGIINPINPTEALDLTPVTDYDITYSIANDPEKIASVDRNTVTFNKEGTVTIEAELKIKKVGYACERSTIQTEFTVIAPVNITTPFQGGYISTFSSNQNRDFSGTGIDVYTIQEVTTGTGSKAKLTKVDDYIVPANTGVILYSTSVQNNPVVKITEEPSASGAYSGNLLIGSGVDGVTVPASVSTYYNYILQNQSGTIAFYKATGKILRANRAYLHTTAAAARLVLDFGGDESTAISDLTIDCDSMDAYYNLSGQRINKSELRSGTIYIVNGKKFVK